MSEPNFAQGIMFKLPRENAPDFVKGSLSINLKDFIAWAEQHQENGWVNIDLKVSKNKKPYAELNVWKAKAPF